MDQGRSTTSSTATSRRAVEPSPLHRFLARLPELLRDRGAPHQLIVTTNYDLALERAFEDAGEELDIVAYVATGPHRGRFWHRPPGEPPRPIDVPNTYATELSLERRTILLKLHGAVDPLPEREWESFVITEDDYIDYLGHSELTAVVPVALAARLRRSHFLFLGYEMADWNLRLILNRIWGERPVAYRSWAVQRSPSALAQAFWRRYDVTALDVDPEAYVELARAPAGDRVSNAPTSPYKGLNAFEDTELDALLFFGRERETEIVVANLIASRLTVLYGPSGVGKSSLLRAAVARSLRALPEEPLVIVFSSWSDDPTVALSEAVGEASGLSTNGSVVTALERVQSTRDVYLVLDQAEEYFLYHADDGGPGSFAEALPAVLAAPSRVNVLVSLREDSLAKLDRFTGRIPSLFANTLRLDRLDRAAARAAVLRPVERYVELTGEAVSVDPDLVERVLDEVGTGQIEPALGGLGGVEGGDVGGRIEAPYLQLVMQRLWEEERASGSTELRVETIDRLGGAQHIVEEHLEGAMADLTSEQKDVAARIFNHLVTPSGTKIAHEVADLADFGQVSESELVPVLTALSERRILRSVDEGGALRYEIFHDVLGEPVLAWRARHRTDGRSSGRSKSRQIAGHVSSVLSPSRSA